MLIFLNETRRRQHFKQNPWAYERKNLEFWLKSSFCRLKKMISCLIVAVMRRLRQEDAVNDAGGTNSSSVQRRTREGQNSTDETKHGRHTHTINHATSQHRNRLLWQLWVSVAIEQDTKINRDQVTSCLTQSFLFRMCQSTVGTAPAVTHSC